MMMEGLGCAASTIDTGFGIKVDCTNWSSWLLNSGCWQYRPSAWDQMCQFTVPPSPVPPPAVDAGTSNVPAPYDCAATPLASPSCPGYDAAVSSALAAGETATQIKNQEWADQQPVVQDSTSWTTIALLAAGIIAAGIFLGGRRKKRYASHSFSPRNRLWRFDGRMDGSTSESNPGCGYPDGALIASPRSR
jgi:hypothetical protein